MFFWVDRDQQSSSDGRDHGPWYIRAMAGYFAACGLWAWGVLCWALIVRKYSIAVNAAIFAHIFLTAAAFFLAGYLFWQKSRFAALITFLIPPAQLYGYARLHPEQPSFFEWEPHFRYFTHLPPWLILSLAFHSSLAVAATVMWKRRLLI